MKNNDTAEHCCSVTLIVTGEDLDPETVTRTLSMAAHKSWTRGEQKSCTLPDGKVLHFESLYEQGGWKRFLPETETDRPLDDQIRYWLSELHKRRDAIHELLELGCRIELNCFAADGEFLWLSNRELRDLAELGVDLSLTIASEFQGQDQTEG